jgi:O-antigen ligase
VDRDYLRDPNVDMPLERLKPFVQHNVFLSLLTETGFVGISLYLLLLGTWSYRAWQLWRMTSLPLAVRQFGLILLAFIANWIVNGMFHDTSLMVNANLLLFMLAGATQGFYARAKVHSPSRSQWPAAVQRSRSRYPVAQKFT